MRRRSCKGEKAKRPRLNRENVSRFHTYTLVPASRDGVVEKKGEGKKRKTEKEKQGDKSYAPGYPLQMPHYPEIKFPFSFPSVCQILPVFPFRHPNFWQPLQHLTPVRSRKHLFLDLTEENMERWQRPGHDKRKAKNKECNENKRKKKSTGTKISRISARINTLTARSVIALPAVNRTCACQPLWPVKSC